MPRLSFYSIGNEIWNFFKHLFVDTVHLSQSLRTQTENQDELLSSVTCIEIEVLQIRFFRPSEKWFVQMLFRKICLLVQKKNRPNSTHSIGTVLK